MPYAAAPVGDLRWRAPEPVEPWPDVRDAREYGWICPQALTGSLEGALGEVRPTNEDCLTLNVHRPADADDDLPVMVWLHGGSFVYGSGSQQAYNSPELARRGVVLVTLNYRLGRLGFFAHPAVQEEGHRLANFGLLDQVAALEWVQDNIAEFGGDPDNVTVFGESAGAISVNALMASPAADGLFARAISQSGFGREPTLTWDAATVEASNAVEELAGPSPSAADLRALSADEVAKIPMDLLAGQAPILDEVLPETVSSTFAAGEEAEVPLLTGTTDLEISGDFVNPGPTVSAVRARLLEDPGPALAAYRTQEELDLHLLADIMFTEPARHLARLHADDAPTFRYLFTIAPGPTLESRGGAPHSSELPFVFDDTRSPGLSGRGRGRAGRPGRRPLGGLRHRRGAGRLAPGRDRRGHDVHPRRAGRRAGPVGGPPRPGRAGVRASAAVRPDPGRPTGVLVRRSDRPRRGNDVRTGGGSHPIV